MSVNRNHQDANSGWEDGNPFREGLSILARIISRVYQRDLEHLRLRIPYLASRVCGGVLTYCGYHTNLEWNIIGDDGKHYLVTATLNN